MGGVFPRPIPWVMALAVTRRGPHICRFLRHPDKRFFHGVRERRNHDRERHQQKQNEASLCPLPARHFKCSIHTFIQTCFFTYHDKPHGHPYSYSCSGIALTSGHNLKKMMSESNAAASPPS